LLLTAQAKSYNLFVHSVKASALQDVACNVVVKTLFCCYNYLFADCGFPCENWICFYNEKYIFSAFPRHGVKE